MSIQNLNIKSILLFLLIAFGANSLRAQVNAEQVLNIGRNVLSMEDYMLSIQYFNQAIKAKPYLADPYFFRGLAKLYLEDYKGAEDDCSLAIERNKFKTESYKVRGFARQNLGKDSLAILDYNQGLLYNPQEKYFLYYKAVAETELNRLKDADNSFETLLKYYPQFEDGYAARAHLRLAQKDTTAALNDLNKAITISKNLINAYLLRAQIQSQQKSWEPAIADMDAAIKLRPQEPELYINRAFLRYNFDDFFGAMSDYNYALELQPENSAAIFNRALLRYEVKDLNRAAEDLKKVLKLNPENFHALYNLGLVNLERAQYKEAIKCFEQIANRFPKFHPAYYAMADAYRSIGNMRVAMQMAHNGDELVRKYVKNPEKNPLDRPTIAVGKSNNHETKNATNSNETESDVMDRFNQLVTVSASKPDTQLSYNEKIKGRVQDRDLQVEPEEEYGLTIFPSEANLKSTSNYFKELDDFNQHQYIPDKIYLNSASNLSNNESKIKTLFERAEHYEGLIRDNIARPADYLALGMLRISLKNYEAAQRALNEAIRLNPNFTIAYFARAFMHQLQLKTDKNRDNSSFVKENNMQAIADYDKALSLDSRLVYAWFNKGNIFFAADDLTSAIQCFTEALNIDPSFGAALFNRGISYLKTGNKRQAFADLSKAGELGIVPSYNLLKRMK